jgi:5-methylcytosine-specific restriction endonuclease McrA
MEQADAIAWTPEMDSLLGTMPDAKVGLRLGLREDRVRYRRIRLGIPSFRSTQKQVTVSCANCGKMVAKRPRDVRRSKRLFCSRVCADAGQKRRDSETLRYGPGWKNRRAEIRARDKACRACGITPQALGHELHVHHVLPFRYGGTNRPENLVALCDSCHHRIEWATDQALNKLAVSVTLDGSSLTITVDGRSLFAGSVLSAAFPTRDT